MLLETVDINSGYLRSIGLESSSEISIIWLIWIQGDRYLEIWLYIVSALVSLRVDVGNITHLSLVVRMNKGHFLGDGSNIILEGLSPQRP